MSKGRQAGDIIVSALAGAGGGFVALFYLDYSLIDANWCGDAQAGCFRDWLSATGGWAATLAAGVTAWFIYGQFSEARRQSAVIARDVLPIVSFFDPRSTSVHTAYANRLQIVNINARPILIKDIRVKEPTQLDGWTLEILDHDVLRKRSLERELRAGRMYVPGIAEREDQRPTVVEIDITFQTRPVRLDLPDDCENLQRICVELAIDVVIVGETHRTETLLVARPDALVVVEA